MVECTQLQSENCCLNAVHAAVPADNGVVILATLAVVDEHPNFLSEFRVVGCNSPRLTEGSEILAWVKTKTSRIAETSRTVALIKSTVCLRSVLHHEKTMLFCKC